MDLLTKINAQWGNLEKLVDGISATSGSENHTAISRIVSALNQVSICFRRVNEGDMRRQQLVERHCSQDQYNQLTLAMHEEYHEINTLLISDINTLFSMIKTYLNSLALFIKEVIPQSQLRGLRFKSFGSLVESAKRTAESNLPNKALRGLIASKGAEFENRYVGYRDKQLEHPGKLTDKSISSTNGVPKIIHYDRKTIIDHGETKEPDIFHDRKECITIMSPEGYKVTYFHIAPFGDLDKSPSINQGQPVGTPYDSTDLHFKKYEYHCHIFSSSEIASSLMEQTAQGGEIFASSPDPYEAILSLGKLTESILRIIISGNERFNA